MNLLVVVCGYAGDAAQIDVNWPSYSQHGAPVLILSPEDSPIHRPGAWSMTGGKKAYIGPVSLDRQWTHLHIMLDHVADYYLVHDADSILLSPEIPAYLKEPKVCLWANVVPDDIHHRPVEYPLPHFACQPPYFFSRETLKRLLAKGNCAYDEKTQTPYIDWYMMALATHAGVPFVRFPDGASCPTSECDVGSSQPGAHHAGYTIMRDLVRNKGVRFVHSVKAKDVFDQLCRDRTEFLSTHQ